MFFYTLQHRGNTITAYHYHIMTNIIKRIISKRLSKVRTFQYAGGGSESIPKNVTHIQFHPSVTEVHDEAFKDIAIS